MTTLSLRRAAWVMAAVVVASVAASSAVWAWGRPATAQQTEVIIEIHPNGFNPPVCQLNRNAGFPVQFLNRDTKPRRIVVDLMYSPIPGQLARDTGWIEPGEIGGQTWTFGEIQDLTYRDYDDPSLTGKIVVPMSNHAPMDCALVTGTPNPGGEGCERLFLEPLGCVVVPKLTSDGPLQ